MREGDTQKGGPFTCEDDLTVEGATYLESWGESPFTALDGLLLLGPGCPMDATSWTTLRGQAATLSGAFHPVNGRWPGTRALMVEEAGLNLETNPSMELGDPPTSYDDYNTPTRSRTADYAKFGTYSQKVIANAANDGVSDTIAADASEDYTFSVWIRADTNTRIYLWLVDQDGNSLGLTPHDVGGTWQKFVLTTTTGVGDTGIKGIVYAHEACTFYIDGYQMEKSSYPTSTCIGNMGTGYAWTGAAHNSTSTRAATEVNLDAYASLLSDNETWSVSLWWQPQYDADANWPPNYMFDLLGGNNNNRILFDFDPADNKIKVYINGGWRLESAAQTFEAGDWQHILLTLNFTADEYFLYINGVEDGSDTSVLTAPTALTQMNLGTDTAGGSVPNATYSELPLFDSVLTAADAAAMFQAGNPLTDQGATRTPSLAGINVPNGMVYESPAESDTLAGLGTVQAFTALNTFEDDLLFSGAGSGIPYGFLYLHEGAQNVDISTAGQGVYVKIGGFTTGKLNNVTVNSDAFRVGAVGVYHVLWHVSGDSVGNNKDYEIDIFVNGVEQPDGSQRRQFGAAGSLGSFSGSGGIEVTNTAHDIDIRMKEMGAGAGTDFDIFNMNFNIRMVGGI